MANVEFETKWGDAAVATSNDGAAAKLLVLVGGVAKGIVGNNLTVGKIRFGTVASAGASGVQGEVRFDADFIYCCVATNTWVRVAIATW